LSGTTWVGRYQKGKTNLDFTEARDSEWQWHQLGHMQVCTSLQAGCPSCHPTNSVEALKVTVAVVFLKCARKFLEEAVLFVFHIFSNVDRHLMLPTDWNI